MSHPSPIPPTPVAHRDPAPTARAHAPAPTQRGADPDDPADPYAAYTDLARQFGPAAPPLDEVLPPFAAGLLGAAGRMLAVLAYRDAFVLGDQPLNRRSTTHRNTLFRRLPAACDRQDRQWRLAWAQCLDDLATDLQAGRAPLPRCTGEQWALRVMADHAPYLLACSDAELTHLGVAVPADDGPQPPMHLDRVADEFEFFEAQDNIPEVYINDQAAGTGADEDREAPPNWFAPFGITVARPADRGHPPWVQDRISGVAAEPPEDVHRAASILGLTGRVDRWAGYTATFREFAHCPVLAEILTPPAATLLHIAARRLAEAGYREVLAQGDAPLGRNPHDDRRDTDTGLLARLPPICDGRDQAWRLAMVRAIGDLADDLAAGQAPLPRCTAEELALHLILSDAQALLDQADDADLDAHQLPPRAAWTPRHRQFTAMREVFLQAEDVLLTYRMPLIAPVATDLSDPPAPRQQGDDPRTHGWFATFVNMRPRRADRGFPPPVLAALCNSPALRHTTTTGDPDPLTPPPCLPPGLVDQFELLVGLAQRRFFPRTGAIAMARTLQRLLVAFLDNPDLPPDPVWMHGDCATVGTDVLIVDQQFCIDGQTHRWRLTSDLPDGEARRWVLGMLTDCAATVVSAHTTNEPSLLFTRSNTAPLQLDPDFPATLAQRAAALAARTTLAGLLTHRRARLGLTLPHVAQAAILPTTLLAGWEAGRSAPPAQAQRCAPVLQLPEQILVRAISGVRDHRFWPLPTRPPAGRTRGSTNGENHPEKLTA